MESLYYLLYDLESCKPDLLPQKEKCSAFVLERNTFLLLKMKQTLFDIIRSRKVLAKDKPLQALCYASFEYRSLLFTPNDQMGKIDEIEKAKTRQCKQVKTKNELYTSWCNVLNHRATFVQHIYTFPDCKVLQKLADLLKQIWELRPSFYSDSLNMHRQSGAERISTAFARSIRVVNELF